MTMPHGQRSSYPSSTKNGFPLKTTLIFLLSFSVSFLYAQTSDKVSVTTLGTFHFNFPNLDANQIAKADQIDVLEPKYQREIEEIVGGLLKFRPTVIVIERQPDQQSKVDSLYQAYVKGSYQLGRREDEQIGFRLAKAAALKKLYCVDEWGRFYENVSRIIDGTDSVQAERFEAFYFHNPDSLKKTRFKPTIKAVGLKEELLRINDDAKIKESLGDYLVGIFKYEITPNDFLGVDFETGRWFNRNLRIFRNIQRIEFKPGDRVLVIFGSGHLNLLNYFFDCSPEFSRIDVREFLR